MKSLKWPALILSHCFAPDALLWETALRDMQDLHTADSLEEHASDQVNVIFLGFLCKIEGGFAKENSWATEKTTSHPFFRYIVNHFVINSSDIPIYRKHWSNTCITLGKVTEEWREVISYGNLSLVLCHILQFAPSRVEPAGIVVRTVQKKNLFFKFVGKTWLLEKIKFVVPLEESSRALCVLQRTSLKIKYVIEVWKVKTHATPLSFYQEQGVC